MTVSYSMNMPDATAGLRDEASWTERSKRREIKQSPVVRNVSVYANRRSRPPCDDPIHLMRGQLRMLFQHAQCVQKLQQPDVRCMDGFAVGLISR